MVIPAKLSKNSLIFLLCANTFWAIMEILEGFVNNCLLAKLKRCLCCLCASIRVTMPHWNIFYLIQHLQNSFVAVYAKGVSHLQWVKWLSKPAGRACSCVTLRCCWRKAESNLAKTQNHSDHSVPIKQKPYNVLVMLNQSAQSRECLCSSPAWKFLSISTG